METVFGRTEVIQLLHKRVHDLKDGYRQNMVFLGSRLVGKTFLLKRFTGQVNDPHIVSCYLEAGPFDFKVFCAKFIGSLLRSTARCLSIAPADSLDGLLASLQKTLPHTVEQSRKILSEAERSRISDAYTQLLSLPEVVCKETGKVCLVILDEFVDLLDSLTIDNAYQELGKKITVQRSCMYILLSSQRVLAKKVLTEKLSLLFGNFEVIELRPFDIQTTRDFIQQHLTETTLTASLQNFLFELTGGNPFYLELICRELLKASRRFNDQIVTLSMLTDVLSDLLYQEYGIFNQYFTGFMSHVIQGKSSNQALSVILAMAKGKRRINDIAFAAHKPKEVILQRLNRLVDIDAVSKNGNFYYLSDKVFAFWIECVFLKKLESFSDADDAEGITRFKTELEAKIDGFLRACDRPLTQRVTELLNLFDNESVQMNGYKYRLYRFKEIRPTLFRELDNTHGLVARSKNNSWLVLLKEDIVREDDVVKFIAECRDSSLKSQKRIIVSLKGIESNAKLKALQEKIWVWSGADINLFLRLHDKHCIVV